MDLIDRAIFFALGGGVGFVLGFIVARLREIKEELDEVDERVNHIRGQMSKRGRVRTGDEKGFMRFPIIADIMLLIVVVVVAVAAFASQRASDQVEEQQRQMTQMTECNKEFLAKTIVALNERTTYTQEQARNNVELQRAQSRLLTVLLEEPPPSEARADRAIDLYYESLNDFVELSGKTASKIEGNPYPTAEELDSCLAED